MLKEHFIESGNEGLLAECSSAAKSGVDLTDTQKCQCVNIVADYGVSVFGLNPSRAQYEMLAGATVHLFNGLKSKTGEPIVSYPIILLF